MGCIVIHISKETKLSDLLCVILVLMTGFVRLFRDNFKSISSNIIIFLLFVFSAFIWISQIKRRIIHPKVQKYLVATGYMVILLIFVRTVKFVFFPDGHIACRFIWYFYYAPQTFMALFMFLAVLHIGKSQNQTISKWWRLLYIPATLIVLFVLTNDFHQLAFKFIDGFDNWNKYTHGIGYNLAILWVIILFLAILIISLSRCAVSDYRKNIWKPLVPLLVGMIYIIIFFIDSNNIFMQLFKTTEIICFIFPAYIESLILAQLFPSNDNYEALWSASNLSGGIISLKGDICCRSKKCVSVTLEQIIKAEHENVPLNDGNIILKSHAINGGYGYWVRDISDINKITDELENLGDLLMQEQIMLEKENRISEEKAKIEQQTMIYYNEIAKSSQNQIEKLKGLLENPPENEKDFETIMKYIAILNAYIKRHSNMVLYLHRKSCFNSDELRYAISESLEYIQLYGITAYGNYQGEKTVSGKYVLLAYEIFEAAIESAIPGADAVMVNLEMADMIKLSIEINSPREYFPEDYRLDDIVKSSGSLEVEIDEESEYIILNLPIGESI